MLRSPSEQSAKGISDVGETSSLDDSSQAASPEGGTPAGSSSFGAILRQCCLRPSKGVQSVQSDRVQTSQQKSDNFDPSLLATSPVQPQNTRDKIPLALSISWPRNEVNPRDSTSTSPELASSDEVALGSADPAVPRNPGSLVMGPELAAFLQGAPSSSNHDRPTRTSVTADLVSKDHEAALPLSGLAELPPGSLKQVTDAPTITGTAEPAQPEAPVTDQSADVPSLPGQVVSSVQTAQFGTLAFAARLSPPIVVPQTGDGAANNVLEMSSVRPQTPAQTGQTQMLTSDAVLPLAHTPGDKGESDAPGNRVVKTDFTPLPTQLTGSGEPATSAKSETRPAFAPTVHAEPATDLPAAPSSSNRDITVRIPNATDRGTNVRFVERGSEVHVSVHTGDPELAQMLRSGLSDLTGRLQHNGIQAEVWRPGSNSSQSDSQNQSAPDPRDSGGSRNQSGAQRDGQDQPSENKPRWVEALETSISEPSARPGH
jgi:hypothetical protein